MKSLRLSISAIALAAAVLLVGSCALVTLPGCASVQHGQARASQSLLVVGEGVNAAMNAYGELYRAGKLDADTVARIDGLHERYRQLFSSSVAAVGADLEQPSPVELSLLAAQLVTAIDAL